MSFKKRLLMAIFVKNIIVLGLVGVLAYRSILSQDESREAQLQAGVVGTLDKVDRNLFERYGDVQAFAMSEPARSMDPKRIRAFMNDMIGAYAPVYDLMIVVNPLGEVVCINTVDKSGKAIAIGGAKLPNLASEPWFQAVTSKTWKRGYAYFSDPAYDSIVTDIYKGQRRTMNFTAPIIDPSTGKLLGVWTNRMSWADVVENIFREEAEKLKNNNMSEILPTLYSAKGEVIMGFDLADRGFINASGIAYGPHQGPGLGGRALMSAATSKGYASYPGIGWKSVFAAPSIDQATTEIQVFTVAIIAVMLFCACLLIVLVSKASSRIETLTGHLIQQAKTFQTSSDHLAKEAAGLADRTTSQSSAIAHVAASSEEMKSMLSQTVDQSARNLQTAHLVRERADRGMLAASQMTASIQQLVSSNDKLRDVVKSVQRIKDRINVVNELAHETRLLAFNASIEAARAGQHGRGFAVVADEVGKLASTSGDASLEINQLLDRSVSEIEQAISFTSERISRTEQTSKSCEDSIRDISSVVEDIQEVSNTIAAATKEQEIGIKQTNTAMINLEKTVESNALSSTKLSTNVRDIKNGADSLDSIIQKLGTLVSGKSRAA